MGNENKHGRYDEFDRGKASWACPKCKKDSLKLCDVYDAPVLNMYYKFVCNECGFDSKDYAVVMGPKSTYNSVHRWLMKEWAWMNYLTRKWAAIGANAMDAKYKEEFEKADPESEKHLPTNKCEKSCAGCSGCSSKGEM